MKAKPKRADSVVHSPAERRATSKKTAPSAKNTLGRLYSRLDQSQPGSEQSKRIADEIIDAIG